MESTRLKTFFSLVAQITLFDIVCGNIIAITNNNITETFKDRDAWFGTAIGPEGIEGLLVKANPLNACSTINERPYIVHNEFAHNISISNFFVIIKRGECGFAEKVFNAQKAKFDAAIVYNVGSDQLVTMKSKNDQVDKLLHMIFQIQKPIVSVALAGNIFKNLIVKDIVIPSVFVGETSGYLLKNFYTYSSRFKPRLEIYNDNHSTLDDFLVPFCAVLAATCFCMLVCLSVRYVRGQVTISRNRLSRQRLKQLPIKKYSKGEECDMCAICLDDYVEGECLRVLPCKHAYHCKCIDPWLTRAKRVCPLCKRRVLSEDNSSVDGDRGLRPAASPNASRFATGFTRRNPFRRYSSSSESDSFVAETEVESISFSIDRIPAPELLPKSSAPSLLPKSSGFSVASSFDGNLPSSPVHEVEDAAALNDDVINAEIAQESEKLDEVKPGSSIEFPPVILAKNLPGSTNHNFQESEDA